MAQVMAVAESANSNEKSETSMLAQEISRPTEELVIGMVGAVGAGVSKTSEVLKVLLEEEFGYSASIVKASAIIRDNAEKVEGNFQIGSGADRIKNLQNIGTKLRNRFGEDYIAAKAIELIAIKRKSEGGYDESTQVPQPKNIRQVTIIDSIKHPAESKLLRKVYGGMYWQFTVFSPEEVREERLKLLGVSRSELSGIFTRDENDKEDHGQQVRKTAFISDFFIRNDGENDERLTSVVGRFLNILFNISVHTPTADEAGMYAAVSAASKSACLSRQVGAAIYSSSNELVSVGWNDVPRAKGGLYSAENGAEDHRCYKWGGKVCHNDRKKEELYEKIFGELSKRSLLATGVSRESLRDALVETPVKNLIEYSRSIHAEMEAIVSAGRVGKAGMVGGRLYTTTFPCHNCARHIVAAGINTVFYVEPYAKSLALELHGDSISLTDNGGKKVSFLQYEGVGPDSVLKLFHSGAARKVGGKVREVDKKSALPILAPPMDGFTTHEKRVITQLENLEK